jgi:hypothetical protein
VGLGAPEPLEPVEGFIPLCHTLCLTLSKEWETALHPLGGIEDPLSLGHLGRWVLARPLARTRDGSKDQAREAVDWELGSQVSPRVPSRGRGVLGFHSILGQKVCTSVPEGYSPRALERS